MTEILGKDLEKTLQRREIQIWQILNFDPTRQPYIVPQQLRSEHLEREESVSHMSSQA